MYNAITMALKDYKESQLKKRQKLLARGITPYPLYSKRTHTIFEAQKDFKEFAQDAKELTLAGRVKTIRRHGGATFVDIQDGTGTLQIFAGRDQLGIKAYEEIAQYVDVGDFIETRGVFFVTKSGEQTLEVRTLHLIGKSIRPLPEKWHGFQEVEERYRKRYLDLIMNPEIKEKFVLRSAILQATRAFLVKNGFQEVETPILQQLPGGASARPFRTHLNALDLDLYIRVALELHLKRLIIGGMEKVFEIGRCFRNEGMDYSHNPEFTMLEFYWAYADYKKLMKLSEALIISVVKANGKGLVREYEEKKINFKSPWPRIEFVTFLRTHTGIDYELLDRDALAEEARKSGLDIEKHAGKAQIADEIYKKFCLPRVADPVFIIHHPVELTPLAKSLEDKPQYAARFQIVVGGWEIVNAYSELNDPVVQRERFKAQEKQRISGDEEAHLLDEDFLEAMEYGMPPAAGFGMGMDRLVALLTNSHALREIILFPAMKPK